MKRQLRWVGWMVALAALGSGTMAQVETTQRNVRMPDALVGEDGRRITREQWPQRREAMRKIIEHYLTGTPPPPPGNVVGKVISESAIADGKVKFRRVDLSFGPDRKLGLQIAIFMPADAKGAMPTIVHPVFYPTPGTTAPAPAPTTGASTRAIERARAYAELADPENTVKLFQQALDRGYAVCAFNYQQAGADKHEYRDSGFFPAYPKCDWADLAAWAWAMSRCVDYLQTQDFADRSKFIALGHSRLGKTALIAGAFDERFALVAPAGSGCAGTGAFRYNGKGRGGKEGLEDIVRNFPQWISPRLGEFCNRVDELPFDQHWLIAMCAPRCFIAVDALGDAYANSNALVQSYLAAKPVYEMLGVPQHIGIHFREGEHELAPEDWRAVLDFADQQLRGMKVDERFDQIPQTESVHGER